MADLVQPFYATFVDEMFQGEQATWNIQKFFHICNGAYFLLIQPLLDLCNAKIASLMKGKTPEQLKEMFQITAPYTPPDEAAVRAKHKWAEYPDCNIPAGEAAKAAEAGK